MCRWRRKTGRSFAVGRGGVVEVGGVEFKIVLEVGVAEVALY